VSGANEYPFAGDLSNPVISGLLHSTLERLARRTAQNNTYITNVYEAGPQPASSSACGGPLFVDASYDSSSAAPQDRYGWTVNYGFASGRFVLNTTALPTLSQFVNQYRYRRNTRMPESVITRSGAGDIQCGHNTMELRDAAICYFSGAIQVGTAITGHILFDLPQNFKGFAAEGIELDLRGQATGLTTGAVVTTFLGIYSPHCDDPDLIYSADLVQSVENTAPGEIVPVSGTADSYTIAPHRIGGKILEGMYKPGDTVKLLVNCTIAWPFASPLPYTSHALYVGALRVNYKE